MKTKYELLEHCRKALKNNVQYVYGAKMEVLSAAQIKNLQSAYGKSFVWDSDLKKAGKLCCDCSGLISSCTGVVRNSSMYKATAKKCVAVADVKKNWGDYVGWAFWMNGHIGVVSDTEGYYFAMDGSARNMVHFPLSRQSWTHALMLCDVDYSAAAELVVGETLLNVRGKVIRVNRILKDGRNFIELRGLENAGFTVGYDPVSKVPSLQG